MYRSLSHKKSLTFGSVKELLSKRVLETIEPTKLEKNYLNKEFVKKPVKSKFKR